MNIPSTPIQEVHLSQLLGSQTSLWVKRDDLIHPTRSGNKYYKLSENIQLVKENGLGCILSFGGGYSNHLYALALTGKELNLKTVGYVRGEYTQGLTPTLQDCITAGMQLHFLSRKEWRLRNCPEFLKGLSLQYPKTLIVPEGGDNPAGFAGTRLLGKKLREQVAQLSGGPVHVYVACGTGTTAAGIIAELPSNCTVHGISVLKGIDTITNNIKRRLADAALSAQCSWSIETDWHFGGYAKFPRELAEFMFDFEQQTSILLDPVYTTKAMYAAVSTIGQNLLPAGAQVVVVHTGGLQGRRGYPDIVD